MCFWGGVEGGGDSSLNAFPTTVTVNANYYNSLWSRNDLAVVNTIGLAACMV